MTIRRLMTGVAALAGGLAISQAVPAQEQLPERVLIRIDTSVGTMFASVRLRAAPVTGCNFLRYAHEGSYDGGRFFRTVRSDRPYGNPNPIDVIQAEAAGGEAFAGHGPIPLERTNETGLSHGVGVLSMARNGPDTATHGFFIVVRPAPELDYGGARNPDGQGFAAFGRISAGMNVVERIHRMEAGDNEHLVEPVVIERVTVQSDIPAQCLQ